MENVNDKKRITYLDIAKGIGILLMVAGHVFYGSIFRDAIFSFHMPLFVIISGMFFKYNNNFKEYSLKIVKRLLIPYVIGVVVVNIGRNIILSENIKILPQVLLGFSNFKSVFVNVETVGALWFIPYLVFIQLIYYYLVRVTGNNDLAIGLECIVIMFCGFYFKLEKVYLPWSIDIAVSTIILFYIGNMIFKYQLIDKIIKNNKLILLFFIIWIIGFSFVSLEFARRNYSIVAFVIAFCGSMVTIKLSYIIDKYLKIIGRFFCWCGKNSVYILIVHYFEYKIFKYTGNYFEIFVKKLIFIMIVTFCITFFKSIIIRTITKLKNKKMIENEAEIN